MLISIRAGVQNQTVTEACVTAPTVHPFEGLSSATKSVIYTAVILIALSACVCVVMWVCGTGWSIHL